MNILLSLFASPLARVVLIGLAAYSFGWWRGYSSAGTAAEVASMRQQISAMKKDKAVADEAARLASQEAEQNGEIARANRRIIEGIRNAQATDPCRLTRDDIRMQRPIR